MKKMEIKVDKQDNQATVEITDEDLAIGYILRKELLENKEVVFAGTVKPHPLVNNFKASAILWNKPKGPTILGPFLRCMAPNTFLSA